MTASRAFRVCIGSMIAALALAAGTIGASTTGGGYTTSFTPVPPGDMLCGKCRSYGPGGHLGVMVCKECVSDCVIIVENDCDVEVTGTWKMKTVSCEAGETPGNPSPN